VAAKHANAHEFILQKPLGYDTVIGEKGVALRVDNDSASRLRAPFSRCADPGVDEATNAWMPSQNERCSRFGGADARANHYLHRAPVVHDSKGRPDRSVRRWLHVESGTHEELIQARDVCKLYELHFEAGRCMSGLRSYRASPACQLLRLTLNFKLYIPNPTLRLTVTPDISMVVPAVQ